MPGIGLAQTSATKPGLTASWGYGLGVGNGLALHLGYFRPHLVVLERVRGKWWQAPNETGNGLFGNPNTRTQQIEVSALLGYPIKVGGTCTRRDVRPYIDPLDSSGQTLARTGG